MTSFNHRIPMLGPLPGAISAQTGGWLIALALSEISPQPLNLPALLVLQLVSAVAIARGLGCAPWWLGIHAAFSPLIALAQSADLPSSLFLGGFCMLALVYWSNSRSQVPLYLSGAAAQQAIDYLFPDTPPDSVLDIGSGTGAFLIPRATRWPRSTLTGIENAPLPWLISRIRAGSHDNIKLVRGSFYRHDWSRHDLIYAFLSPAPMDEVWQKAQREMKPSGVLVSNTFPVPGVIPDEVLGIDLGRRKTLFYVYRPAKRGLQAQN